MNNHLEDENEVVPEDIDPARKPGSSSWAGDSDDLSEEYAGNEIKKLKEKLKATESKAREYLDGWQRAQADFANLRRRDEEAKMEFLKFANQGLIEELIHVMDSDNIAIASGHKELEPVYKQFISVLKSKGLEELEPKGETFNPSFHEAIGMEKVESAEADHKVIQVVQKGYRLGERVVRPAKVKIGEYSGS